MAAEGIVRPVLRTLSLLACSLAGVVFGQSSPVITSVVDAYSGGATLCPGGIALIVGNALGTAPKVTIGGKVAYDLLLPATTAGKQMTVEIPVDAPLGATTVTISLASGASSQPFPITLTQYAPVLIHSASGSVLSPVHQQSGLLVTAGYPAAPGETITVSAIGLGPTNVSVPTGTPAPANVSTAAAPAVTLGPNPAPGATAGLAPGQVGIYQVLFVVPSNTATGSYPLSLSIGGSGSNSLTLPVGPVPSGPVVTSVLDAVLAGSALCPGGLATLSGFNLGANPQVTVGGTAAFTVTAPQDGYQMVIQIPVDAPLTNSNVVVTNGAGQSSPPFPIALGQFAPVLYNSASGSIISPMHQSTGAAVTSANPALPNETIVLYAIGLGPTNPSVPTGTPAPAGVPTAMPPNVMLGGQTPIPGATAALVQGQVGVYEITFQMPASPPTGNPFLWIQVGTPGESITSNYLNMPVVLSLAAPMIDGFANNYSYIPPGLPNYGIAQGSIFDIFGSHLANGETNLQNVPLHSQLQGVTVSIAVNGTVTQALLYFVTPNQIGAILPSATPVGDGTLTVNNGVSSSSAPIHVVQSAFGILTLNGAGSGPASAFDVNFNQLGFTNALNPGDYFILWGTGVGPSPGPENVTQTPTDLTNVPFAIEVGGLPAQVVYHGRSQYPGLDQVIGIVPAGVTPGCWVSVATRSGSVVSNFATLPVAASGRGCADPTLGLTASQISALLAKSTFHVGMLQLQKQVDTQFASGNSITEGDSATAAFLAIKPVDFASSVLGPSIGSCLVTNTSNGGGPWGSLAAVRLNAGQGINITGANGTVAVSYQNNSALNGQATFGSYLTPSGLIPLQNSTGAYFGNLDSTASGGSPVFFIPDSGGGQYSFDNGTGGTDVGPFQASIALPSPLLGWPQAGTLNRSQLSLAGGLTVTWSNGDANSFMKISGRASAATVSPGGSVEFTCSVPATAGRFTIPASVLLSVPTTSTNPAVDPALTPVLQAAELSFPQSFAAPDLDFGTIQAIGSITIVVYYQ